MSKTNTNHIAFFKTYFGVLDTDHTYMEREVNGWWLIRHWDGNKQQMTVDLYSAESYRNYNRNKMRNEEFGQQQAHLRSI